MGGFPDAVALGEPMTAWREQSFWSKAWTYALLALVAALTIYTGANWSGGGSSNRKRVFSPNFIALCVFVAVVELIALNHFYVRLD